MKSAPRGNIKIQLDGLDKLADRLSRISETVRRQAARDIQDFGLQVVNDAKRAAPVDMGVLRNSIRFYFLGGSGLIGEISTNCGYGAFVEFGTGPLGRATWKGELPPDYIHGPGGKMPPLAPIRDWCRRHKIPEKMAYVIARKIGKAGLRARPYFTPAWDKARRDFEQEWRDIEDLVRRTV